MLASERLTLGEIGVGLDTNKVKRRRGGVLPSLADIYEPFLAPIRERATNVLEIGVERGGSLQLWERYFPNARIIGVDIKPGLERIETDRIAIRIGDQGNPEFLDQLIAEAGSFDLVLDDGSHRSEDQRAALLKLWPHVKPGGVYVVEDLNKSYQPDYLGDLGRAGAFIEFAKRFLDDVHVREHKGDTTLADLQEMHVYWKTLVLCKWAEGLADYRPPPKLRTKAASRRPPSPPS